MMESLIISNITQHLPLSQKESDYFLSLITEKKLSKKQFLVHNNETSKHTAFVMSGCLRSYSVDQNGFEHILQFAPPGWWMADIGSLVTKQPGQLNIDAIVDSEILLLSRDHQEELFLKLPKIERFFRIIMEKSLAANSSRMLDYMGKSAQERYAVFFKRYPMLAKTIPQKHIAAYIGVTPEFLSKLKADLLKQEKS